MLSSSLRQLARRQRFLHNGMLSHLRCATTDSTKLPRGHEWKMLKLQGELINPCNSTLHPAVREAKIKPEGEELPIQHAYGGESFCFGCGKCNEDGLHLKSYRIKGGLLAKITLQKKHLCFPGIISGGIITTLFDCHGNWSAAIALMDKATLLKPPLTLTSEILVDFKEPTPAGEELIVRSQVVEVRDRQPRGAKSSVQVDLSLSLPQPGNEHEPEKTLAVATGIFTKIGALRAM
jgi:acyl-coenzyme A thioesterase PaaI-like protein